MMKYLVVSRKAGLFHLAKWLAAESEPGAVEVRTLSHHGAKTAWKGILDRVELVKGRAEVPDSFDGLVITDDHRWTEAAKLRARGSLPVRDDPPTKSPIALGGWWDGGLRSPHWVLTDWGLWPGGLGPQMPGAFALVAPGAVPPPVDLFTPHHNWLVAQGNFRGPVTLDLAWDPEARAWRSGTLRAGWEGWHGLALVQGSRAARPLFEAEAAPELSPFVVCVPVSVPPFPFSAPDRPEGLPVATTPETERSLILGDITRGRNGLVTAGVDGSVALAIGRGRFPASARDQAVQVAQSLGLPEGQFRVDAGQGLERFLSGLERLGWF